VSDQLAQDVVTLSAKNIPMVDYHMHLKQGLTIEQALRHSHQYGIQYGIAVNCGKGFPVEDEAGARKFAEEMAPHPVFIAMQAEGREWVDMFPDQAVAVFDYCFTDSMTWTDNRGKRMRLWMPREVGRIADDQEFMETLVARTVKILTEEPIDIYVNPTFLPAQLAGRYDQLWTEERMRKVVLAAKENQVAIEINNRYRLPSEVLLRMAKEEGCKFAFGTNNTKADDLGRCEYGIEITKKLNLGWRDFFVPRAWWPRAIDRKS
jgi:hypothetical protein